MNKLKINIILISIIYSIAQHPECTTKTTFGPCQIDYYSNSCPTGCCMYATSQLDPTNQISICSSVPCEKIEIKKNPRSTFKRCPSLPNGDRCMTGCCNSNIFDQLDTQAIQTFSITVCSRQNFCCDQIFSGPPIPPPKFNQTNKQQQIQRNDKNDNSLSVGAVSGIALSGCVIAFLLGFGIWYLKFYKNGQQQNNLIQNAINLKESSQFVNIGQNNGENGTDKIGLEQKNEMQIQIQNDYGQKDLVK